MVFMLDSELMLGKLKRILEDTDSFSRGLEQT